MSVALTLPVSLSWWKCFTSFKVLLCFRLEIWTLIWLCDCDLDTDWRVFLLLILNFGHVLICLFFYFKINNFQVIAGAVVNIVSVLFLVVAMNLWIVPFYGLTTIPPGFLKNVTTTTTAALLNTTTGIPMKWLIVHYNFNSSIRPKHKKSVYEFQHQLRPKIHGFLK